jgi:hypothetical protein
MYCVKMQFAIEQEWTYKIHFRSVPQQFPINQGESVHEPWPLTKWVDVYARQHSSGCRLWVDESRA